MKNRTRDTTDGIVSTDNLIPVYILFTPLSWGITKHSRTVRIGSGHIVPPICGVCNETVFPPSYGGRDYDPMYYARITTNVSLQPD